MQKISVPEVHDVASSIDKISKILENVDLSEEIAVGLAKSRLMYEDIKAKRAKEKKLKTIIAERDRLFEQMNNGDTLYGTNYLGEPLFPEIKVPANIKI